MACKNGRRAGNGNGRSNTNGSRAGQDRQHGKVLAIGGAAGFMAIDVYYAYTRDRIWDVYLLDAAAQFVFIVLWIAGIIIDSRRSQNV